MPIRTTDSYDKFFEDHSVDIRNIILYQLSKRQYSISPEQLEDLVSEIKIFLFANQVLQKYNPDIASLRTFIYSIIRSRLSYHLFGSGKKRFEYIPRNFDDDTAYSNLISDKESQERDLRFLEMDLEKFRRHLKSTGHTDLVRIMEFRRFGCTLKQIATCIGKSHTHVADRVRLLREKWHKFNKTV